MDPVPRTPDEALPCSGQACAVLVGAIQGGHAAGIVPPRSKDGLGAVARVVLIVIAVHGRELLAVVKSERIACTGVRGNTYKNSDINIILDMEIS